jgi:broad specificity phosphatase PhoE
LPFRRKYFLEAEGTRRLKWNLSFYVQAAISAGASLSARILLTRHASHDEVGRVLSGRSDIALNARGRAEAVRLSTYLAGDAVTAIYSSPRRRAVQTAQQIAAGLEAQIEQGLDEIDFGEWTGRTFAELDGQPDWRHWNTARGRARVPAGENMAEVTSRAVDAVERIAAGGGTIACVSHCDVIRALVAHYLGLDVDRLLSFDVDPASVSIIAFGAGPGRVVAVNRVAA